MFVRHLSNLAFKTFLYTLSEVVTPKLITAPDLIKYIKIQKAFLSATRKLL